MIHRLKNTINSTLDMCKQCSNNANGSKNIDHNICNINCHRFIAIQDDFYIRTTEIVKLLLRARAWTIMSSTYAHIKLLPL